MPWNETNAVEQRVQFIRHWLKKTHSVSDLSALYSVSRKTAYKWIERYMRDGPDWSMDRSHAAAVVHNKTPLEVEEALVRMRLQHPTWGARKLIHQVGLAEPLWTLPQPSTVCDLLKRRGLVHSRPRRRAIGHPGRPSTVLTGPNDSWSADFKGQFRTGDGLYCYPLTVTDNYSRYILGCQALAGTLLEPTQAVFTRLFKEHGLPRTIKTDNGTPFPASWLNAQHSLAAALFTANSSATAVAMWVTIGCREV